MFKKVIVFIAVFLCMFSCANQKKTEDIHANINSKDFFPLVSGCSWIYIVGKDKLQYHVRILAADKEGGMIVWGNKTFTYAYKNDGIYNSTENYYTIRNDVLKWEISKGTAEYVKLDGKVTVPAGTYNAIAVKEIYPERKFYTVSYYGYKTGLIKFEVFSLEGGNGGLIEKMELGSYICSDSDTDSD